MINEKHEVASTSNASISYYTLIKIFLTLIKNKPQQIATITGLWALQSPALNTYLGNETLRILEGLYPDLYEITRTILSSNEQTNIDEVYESIHPLLEHLFNKNIADYGVCLNDINIRTYLTESFIKTNLLPLFLLVRDIPKFCKSIKERNYLQLVSTLKAQLLTRIETDLHNEISKHLKTGSDDFYPVAINEPALATQIKKILNALHYAEKIITFINSAELNPDTAFKVEALIQQKGTKQVSFVTQIIWYLASKDSVVGNALSFPMDLEPAELNFLNKIEQTIDYLRLAQTSLLEIDIPLYQLFSKEINILSQIINDLHTWTAGSQKELSNFNFNNVDTMALTANHYIGRPLGTFIEQLNPDQKKIDYSLLTSQFGLLPGYLDKLTQLIYSYGTNKPQQSSALSEHQIDIYNNASIKLLFELNQFNDLLFWQQSISALMPIRRNVTTLGYATYEQALLTQEAIQEMAEYQLYLLKYIFFAHLICGTDKLELYLGLRSGTLAKPLMLTMNKLYQKIVEHVNTLVNLKEKNPDLLQLDNTSFLVLRLQNMLQQKNECQKKVDESTKAKHHLNSFVELFNQFPTLKEKAVLRAFYQSFKSYVIEYNPKLSVLIDQSLTPEYNSDKLPFTSDEIVLMGQAIANLCDKDMATYSCYLLLSDKRLVDYPKQIKGTLYALDPQKAHSILIINEPHHIGETQNSSLEGTLLKEHQFVNDLIPLSTENRSNLYDYHAVRVLTLRHIEKAIPLFLEQINKTDWFLDKKKINAILEQYRILQPYLVDSLPLIHDKTDATFIDLLNQLLEGIKPKSYIAIVNAMNTHMNKLKQLVQHESVRSEHRQVLFEFAQQKIREEQTVLFGNAPLTLESELVQHQDRWIRHQHLSRAAETINEIVINLLSQLDPCLKLPVSLNTASNTVPFPEMEQDLIALTVPSQVSWAKRLINVIHYINSNFKYLESLDRNVRKTGVTHLFVKGGLIEGLYQLKPFLEITKAYQTYNELMQEPMGQVFHNTLQDAFNDLMKVWQSHCSLYFVNANLIKTKNSKSINSNGLWYTLLPILVLPEHLKELSKGNPYTSAHAAQAQKKAKEITQSIEDIITKYQAGHYFTLLEKSPFIVSSLLPDLMNKLNELRASIHNVTIHNLKDIQCTLYRILKETDALEAKFSLTIGLISTPTKLVLDQLFKGFIESLDISLLESTQLLQAPPSFQERLDHNRLKQEEVEAMQASEKEHCTALNTFLKTLQQVKTRLDAKQEITAELQEELKQQYSALYLFLQSQHRHYALSLNQRDKSIELDSFCSCCLNEILESIDSNDKIHRYPPLQDLLYLVKHVHAAQKGNINSLEMRSIYLRAQAHSIKKEQQFFEKQRKNIFEEHIQHAVDKQIEQLCKIANPLVYLNSEFDKRLREKLLSRKKELIKKAHDIPTNDLEQTIAKELKEEIDTFNRTDYLQLQHLDCIYAQIERFLAYCQHEKENSLFENTETEMDTLTQKIKLLNSLKDIAQGKNIECLNERVEAIKTEAAKATFYTILMSQDKRLELDVRTLKRVFYNLFHSIFNFFGMNYGPKSIYTSLRGVIDDQHFSKIKPQNTYFGFFINETKQQKSGKESASKTPDLSKKPDLSRR